MSEEMSYIGRTKCGCLVAAVVIREDHPEIAAEHVADFIRDGLTIEQMSCEAVRRAKWGCSHKSPTVTASGKGAGE